jgi:hypothetical protein
LKPEFWLPQNVLKLSRPFDDVLSFDRIGRLMDAEILGGRNYTALDLLRDMRKEFGKKPNTQHSVYLSQKLTTRLY